MHTYLTSYENIKSHWIKPNVKPNVQILEKNIGENCDLVLEIS